jgi:hypothetical protein
MQNHKVVRIWKICILQTGLVHMSPLVKTQNQKTKINVSKKNEISFVLQSHIFVVAQEILERHEARHSCQIKRRRSAAFETLERTQRVRRALTLLNHNVRRVGLFVVWGCGHKWHHFQRMNQAVDSCFWQIRQICINSYSNALKH